MDKSTETQVLEYLRWYAQEYSIKCPHCGHRVAVRTPTLDQIALATTGLTWRSSAHVAIRRLVDRGLVERRLDGAGPGIYYLANG